MELKARCKERFEPVVQAIRQLQKEKEGLDEPLIVAIDGRCGSGKLHWENIWSRYSTVICSEWMTFFCAWNSVRRSV